MALSDGELRALQATVEVAPASPRYRDLGREWMRRREWKKAVAVLEKGVERRRSDHRGRALLARALLEAGAPRRAVRELDQLPDELLTTPAVQRLRIVGLDRAGRGTEAREAAEAYLGERPLDELVGRVWARHSPLPPGLSTPDPHVCVGRAEAYAASGDLARAVRTYRRIRLHQPEHAAVAFRLGILERIQAARAERASSGAPEEGSS